MKLPCEAESFSFHGAEESAKIASLLNLVGCADTKHRKQKRRRRENKHGSESWYDSVFVLLTKRVPSDI